MNDEHLIPLLERYAASRDPALRDELFEHYLPLARAVARKFSGRGVETEDLEQVAGMALLKALERFDPARGFRFVTYAVPTITGDVRNYLRDKSGLMRMPRDMRQRLYQMTQEQERFEREHLRTPTAVELSERMGIAPEEFLALLALRTQMRRCRWTRPWARRGIPSCPTCWAARMTALNAWSAANGPSGFCPRWAIRSANCSPCAIVTAWVSAKRPDAWASLRCRCPGWNGARSAACGPWRPRHNEAWNVKGGWRVCNRTPINRRILIRRDRPAP